ncbi:MAG: histidine triad nucleotide-binding protein [Firmicutes bacterium]|nr:histidine triad nucleotide-binding protein [Bacillota bacterium]
MEGCLFCKIAGGEIKSDVVYQDDRVVAFRDINPQAPVHLLIIPREHIPTISDLREQHRELVGHIFLVAGKLADQLGVAREGYRVVANCREAAGQTVFHAHFHLLGGRQFGWPPG